MQFAPDYFYKKVLKVYMLRFPKFWLLPIYRVSQKKRSASLEFYFLNEYCCSKTSTFMFV